MAPKADLERQIEHLMQCKQLTEAEVKTLCEQARTILVGMSSWSSAWSQSAATSTTNFTTSFSLPPISPHLHHHVLQPATISRHSYPIAARSPNDDHHYHNAVEDLRGRLTETKGLCFEPSLFLIERPTVTGFIHGGFLPLQKETKHNRSSLAISHLLKKSKKLSMSRSLDSKSHVYKRSTIVSEENAVTSDDTDGFKLTYLELIDVPEVVCLLITQSLDDHCHLKTLKPLSVKYPTLRVIYTPNAKALLDPLFSNVAYLEPGQSSEIEARNGSRVKVEATAGPVLGPP